jgi:hypothetical protein
VGWAVLSGAGASRTRHVALHSSTRALEPAHPGLRGASVLGADGRVYAIVANFGLDTGRIGQEDLPKGSSLVSGEAERRQDGEDILELPPGSARVFVAERALVEKSGGES